MITLKAIALLPGCHRISGAVDNMEPPLTVSATPGLGFCLLQVVLYSALLPVAVVSLLCVWIVSLAISLMIPRRTGHLGFFGTLTAHTLASLLTRRRLLPVRQTFARDIRIQMDSGDLCQARITGDHVTGCLNVGDTVDIAGPRRRGILTVWRGKNRTTGSDI